MKRLILCLLLFFTVALASGSSVGSAVSQPGQRGPQAYVSLLYGDAFLLGLRVLGQSLRETGTDRDLLALVTGNVSQSSLYTLRNDGWVVREVEAVQNPGRWTQTSRHKFPARFWAVYTKLLIFNLTDYERVVYVDADAIVMRNMDDLFLCDGFCGVMRHSERLNTGVMVLQPSTEVFQDIMTKVANTPSYTGGDQGFLNSYFSDFMEAPFFDPTKGVPLSEDQPQWTSATGIKMGRLSTLFNADTGLFVLNSNRWTLPEKEIRVLHYTLAVFKPWDWWTTWIMKNVDIWQALRRRLPPSSDGMLYGETRRQLWARRVALPLPLLLAALLLRRHLWSGGLSSLLHYISCWLRSRVGGSSGCALGSGSSSSSSPSNGIGAGPAAGQCQLLFEGGVGVAYPAALPVLAILAGMLCMLAALGISTHLIIPSQIRPVYGWVMAYEWTVLLFVVFFSQFLRACYQWGRRAYCQGQGIKAESTKQYSNGLQRRLAESIWLFTLILGGLGLVPWWADIVRVEAFAAKVVLTAVTGVVTALVCAQAFIELAASWYQFGRVEARHSRSAAVKHMEV